MFKYFLFLVFICVEYVFLDNVFDNSQLKVMYILFEIGKLGKFCRNYELVFNDRFAKRVDELRNPSS